MELKIKEAFEGLEQKPDRDELLDKLKDCWEIEKSKAFRPDGNRAQIAALLCCSHVMRDIMEHSDELKDFDEFIRSALNTLREKTCVIPHGAMLANAIQFHCTIKKSEEPVEVEAQPPF